MVIQSQAWMTSFLFNKLSSFFKRSNASGIFEFNQHFLVIDIHGSHDMLKAVGWV